MDRYDNYDQHIFPGSIICWVKKGELRVGKVAYITYKGTLMVQQYLGTKYGYEATLSRVRTWNIIKLTPEMGVQTN